MLWYITPDRPFPFVDELMVPLPVQRDFSEHQDLRGKISIFDITILYLSSLTLVFNKDSQIGISISCLPL